MLSSLLLSVLAVSGGSCPVSIDFELISPTFEYVVRIADPASGIAEVELTVAELSPGDEPLVLGLPERGFAFVRLDEPLLEGEVAARDDAGAELVVERTGPFRWSVTRPASGDLHVQWRVPHRHREIPEVAKRDAYEYPYLAEDHGMLVGGTLFLVPERSDPRVRFELPEGWSVLCPWPEVEPGVFAPGSTEILVHDLVAIGTWEEQRIEAGGCEITVAIAPGQKGLMDTTGPLIEQIVTAEIELFGRVPRGKYLFLFGRPDPPGRQGSSLAGSPKNGSMTLMVQGFFGPRGPGAAIGHLIAHEFFHTWTSSTFGLPDELRYVGEGFTDYYAYLVLAREGLTSWEQFAKTVEGMLSSYLDAASRAMLSLEEAGGPRFFESGDAYTITYNGGFLVAALMDRRIRALGDGRSLDDFMRAFNNDPRWSGTKLAPTSEDFHERLAQFLPDEAAHFAELAKIEGAIDFAAALNDCGVETSIERRPAKLSLRANLDGNRIRDIDPRGLGGRLGLKAGDVLLEVNGTPCETPDQVQSAWRKPVDGRIRFTFERAGERHAVDESVPEETVVTVDPEPWKAHQPTPAGS